MSDTPQEMTRKAILDSVDHMPDTQDVSARRITDLTRQLAAERQAAHAAEERATGLQLELLAANERIRELEAFVADSDCYCWSGTCSRCLLLEARLMP